MTSARVVLVGLGVGAATLLVACSTTCGSIQAADYDQSCSTASDCVAVTEGNSCTSGIFCNCTNAAINVSAQAEYEANLKTVGTIALCPCPEGATPTCDAGVCVLY